MPCRADIAGIGQMETEDATQRDRVSDAKNIRQCKEMLSMGGHDTLGTTWLAGKTRLYVILRPGHQFSLCPLLSITSFKIRSELLPLSSLHLFDIKQLICQMVCKHNFRVSYRKRFSMISIKDPLHATLNSPKRNAGLGSRRRSMVKRGILGMPPQQPQDAIWGHWETRGNQRVLVLF